MRVVTRFAPSPTGFVHVGSHRTALYNYLFARQQGGKFILRIEDTDQKRYVKGAVENLLSSLRRLGIDYDAGPGKEDEKGPYFQSRRITVYRKAVDQLLQKRDAYRCFCTTERLEELRKNQMAQKLPPAYDGRCRELSQEESDRRARQEAFVIRLKTPREGNCVFRDIVRGDVEIAWSQIDDQVLMKSDGFPTYHLANVVDDHFMEVTHIIRGEEWLPSVPKHLHLYRCFGWNPPQMAHLPLLLNPDRSKLSKRQGDVAIEDYLKKGYVPEALNNFLALLGWNPGEKNEIYSMEELIRAFDINRIVKAGAVFDLQKLNWMNGQYIRSMENGRYLKEARQWVDAGLRDNPKIETALFAVKTAVNTFAEIPEKLRIFREAPRSADEEARKMLEDASVAQVFTEFLLELEKVPEIDEAIFKCIMKKIQEKSGIKGKQLWMPLRIALTGEMHGPELGYIVEYLGKAETSERLKGHLNK
ncbi:MAG: glutamate--tRNA ligase [Candidatus Neomarinimicrobiota bacterium]|nr:glutamate--tRNA ligase [Candidatus Neomarinimicrobiota bacterium]MDX9780112.1 glutamate--tRNA ligase [bacterium]